MEAIRAIWEVGKPFSTAGLSGAVSRLYVLEEKVRKFAKLALAAASEVFDEDDAKSITSIVDSANVDLVAGCELARCGYFKQAYSLWRAWFEQSLFAIYFLEASLHRQVWRVVDAIEQGKRPLSQLMLHQMLTEGSSDKAHPFATAYSERFKNLLDGLKKSNLPKERHLIKLAEYRLTDLSQGVHGTYRPSPLRSQSELSEALERHALPLLESTAYVYYLFWFLCIMAKSNAAEEDIRAILPSAVSITKLTITQVPNKPTKMASELSMPSPQKAEAEITAKSSPPAPRLAALEESKLADRVAEPTDTLAPRSEEQRTALTAGHQVALEKSASTKLSSVPPLPIDPEVPVPAMAKTTIDDEFSPRRILEPLALDVCEALEKAVLKG